MRTNQLRLVSRVCGRGFHSVVAIVIAASVQLSGCGADAVPSKDTAQGQINAMALRMQAAIEQCKADLSSPSLDAIRSKADPLRVAADGEPPLALISNDTFASDSDRAVIAEWMNLRNQCLRRFDALAADLPTANGVAVKALEQQFACSKVSAASVGELILGLYQDKLTYGEFARKRYEFTRDASAISAAINQAAREPDEQQLAQARQQMAHAATEWETYIRELWSRQPGGAVEIRGGRR